MKKLLHLAFIAVLMMVFTGCKENYSVGEKVGNLIEFTKKGVIWDSWEGRMNLTQTGMNTAGEPFTFSLDNDRDDQQPLVDLLYQAQIEGWKIKIKYHKVMGWNWFGNRGRSDYFVDEVTVLDKDFANPLRNVKGGREGHIIDTVYVVIDKSEVNKMLKK